MRLPRQRIWPILPGVRSFLNCFVAVSSVVSRGLPVIAVGHGCAGGVPVETYLCRNVDRAIGNVEVARHEHQARGHVDRRAGRRIGIRT